MNLQTFLDVAGYYIAEAFDSSEDYDLSCGLAVNSKNNINTAEIIFDSDNGEVLEVRALDYLNNRAYRMFFDEEDDNDIAFDDVKFVDLTVEKDFLRKLGHIMNEDTKYDTRVDMEIEIEDDLLFQAMLNAHKQDITLNDYIQRILQAYVEK